MNPASQTSPPIPLHIHPLATLSVVLVSPRNTLNIGAVARAMSNFGASDLRVANIFYKDFRSTTSAVGPSAELLRNSRDFASTAEAVCDAHLVVGTSGATGLSWEQPLERLELGAQQVRAALDRGERVALLFGSEKFGLSKHDMSHCHLLLRIPTRDAHPSMNLGQAAALCLYELARVQPGAAATSQLRAPQTEPDLLPAEAAMVERLNALLIETLIASEYPGIAAPSAHPAAHSPRTRQLRTLLHRMHLSGRDTTVLTGFLRQMLWKLRQNQPPAETDRN